jgi:hypothetical protein
MSVPWPHLPDGIGVNDIFLSLHPRSPGESVGGEQKVRIQRIPLSLPRSPRPTPIATTALRFSIYLDAEGVRELRIAAQQRSRG